eukprot:2932306-Prymnesium_polylepis.2
MPQACNRRSRHWWASDSAPLRCRASSTWLINRGTGLGHEMALPSRATVRARERHCCECVLG